MKAMPLAFLGPVNINYSNIHVSLGVWMPPPTLMQNHFCNLNFIKQVPALSSLPKKRNFPKENPAPVQLSTSGSEGGLSKTCDT